MSGAVDIQQALRQIFERLGGIEQRLLTGSKRHDEFSQSLAEIEGKVDKLENRAVVLEVAAVKLAKIEAKVEAHDAARSENIGKAKFIKGVVRSGYALAGAVGAGLTWLVQHVFALPWPKP
jgi:ParB-like chromosome segregation protein Spo0J